jgi:tripartite-type tricarboxylate transporter receptor subunit TctC
MLGRHGCISNSVVLFLALTIPLIGCLNLSPEAFAASKVEYPTKPITMVISYEAGGGTDLCGRILAHAMEPFLSNKVIILNRPGAAGRLGIQEVLAAEPDGYTLLYMSGTPIIQTYMTKKQIDYTNFQLLCVVNRDYFALVVPQKAKWATYEEFIRDAKSNPGKIRISHPGVGSTQNLALPLFEQGAGIKLQYVPFKGNAPAHNALLGGHIDAAFSMVGDITALAKSKEVRILAVSGEGRQKEYPEVPTFKEKNGVDISISHWKGVWAPKKVPESVLDILEGAIQKAANTQGYSDKMIKTGFEPDNIVGRSKLHSLLEKEDSAIKASLKSMNMLEK